MAAGGKRRSFYADLDHMRSLFNSVDTSKTGYIGFAKLCVLVRSIPGIEEAAVPELMERLDRDKDGKVREMLVWGNAPSLRFVYSTHARSFPAGYV